MSLTQLSDAHQNYVKVIWSLTEWTDKAVTTSSIANRLDVRPSAVSDTLRRLDELGLVVHAPYQPVELTPLGERYAIEMVRRHRLIETFLVEILGYGWDEVHQEAEQLEHAVSEEFIAKIEARLGYPTKDPHGDPIPSASGEFAHVEAVRLSEAPVGQRLKVERIADDDSELLKFFADRDIGIGKELEVSAGVPFSDTVNIQVVEESLAAGEPIVLGQAAARAVWVSVLPQ